MDQRTGLNEPAVAQFTMGAPILNRYSERSPRRSARRGSASVPDQAFAAGQRPGGPREVALHLLMKPLGFADGGVDARQEWVVVHPAQGSGGPVQRPMTFVKLSAGAGSADEGVRWALPTRADAVPRPRAAVRIGIPMRTCRTARS